MSELFHLRIHLGEISQNDIYKFLSEKCEVIICVFESHDNRPHLHILFKETKITKSAVIQGLLKNFPSLKGNGAYSCSKTDKMKKKKVGDDEKAIAYLCKGENRETMPILVGVSTIDIELYHNKYWEVNDHVKAVNMGCQNGSAVTQSKKTKSWSEKVYDQMKELYEVEINTIIGYHLDTRPSDYLQKKYDESRQILFCYMMKCLGKGVKKLNENIIRDLWSGILNAILQEDEEAGPKYALTLFTQLILRPSR